MCSIHGVRHGGTHSTKNTVKQPDVTSASPSYVCQKENRACLRSRIRQPGCHFVQDPVFSVPSREGPRPVLIILHEGIVINPASVKSVARGFNTVKVRYSAGEENAVIQAVLFFICLVR